MPLTDTAVRRAKPADKPQRLFDAGGLYLEVSPAGGKWWRLKYRFGGKEKRLSLGVYPDVRLAEARERRDQARKQLAAGTDPGQARKAEKEADRIAALNTLEAVARDWLGHRAQGWAAHTHDNIMASLQNHVFPTLGARPVSDITPAEIREAVKTIDKGGARETAGRVFQRLRAIFRYAVQHDLCAADPTYPLKAAEILSPHKAQHRAALAEADVHDFLRRLDAYDGNPSTRAALELLMLTAVRPGELRGARWVEFDEAKAVWRVPAERMKMKTEHLVPLSKQALATLERARAAGGRSELVFPSPYYPRKPLSDGTLNSALARLGYKGIATAHGFRTLFSTAANEAGWNPDAIERQLAHEPRDEVRGAYNRAKWMPDRTKLMQWWADRIDELRKGADIIPFKAA